MQPIPAIKETKQLRSGIDERRSEWVSFPNGKFYLLPVVARHQKIVPEFSDDGSVAVHIEAADDTLAKLVDQFFEMVTETKEADKIILKTVESIVCFLGLVRHLL